MGTVNNYLEVKSSDFEVFEALAYDSTGNNVVKGMVKNYIFITVFNKMPNFLNVLKPRIVFYIL